MSPTARTPRRRPRLVVLVTHPIQYYAPLYRCLAERGAIDLKVIYLSDAGAAAHVDRGFGREVKWDIPLLKGYDFRVLQPGSSLTARGFWRWYDARLGEALSDAQPDWVLLYGYASRMNWAALRWARARGVRLAYTSDSNLRDPQRRLVVPVKRLALRYFFNRVDAFLATSEANEDYLRSFHADPSRIHRVPFAIDVARFKRDPSSDLARRYDFLWAGKFIPLKRAGDFIHALALLSQRDSRPIKVCVVGDGPLRASLHRQAKQLPAHCVVDFPGFVNQQGMPDVLQAAEALVFTSDREAYGLIAAEAAAAGLALIVADNIGCVGASDLARQGVNALTFPARDVSALARAMGRLLDDPTLQRSLQRASAQIADESDLRHAAAVIEGVVCGARA